jgi:ribosomal protein S18 acetylase RimI-like enzyme
MLRFKQVSELTIDEMVALHNRGFEGYFVEINMTVEQFVARMGTEGLSPRLSVVAVWDGRPVGFVMNGMRQIGDQLVAWNGGTGVIPEFRRQGIGEEMMRHTLDLYIKEGVNIAMLEAITENIAAIGLYKKLGYEIIDTLLFVHREGAYEEEPFLKGGEERFEVRQVPAERVRLLPFYRALAAWQCQWESIKNGGEVLFAYEGERVVGYAMARRSFDKEGNPWVTKLYHLAVDPQHGDGDAIRRKLLAAVYGDFRANYRRSTFNLSAQDSSLAQMLEEAGFTPYSGQVMMTYHMR